LENFIVQISGGIVRERDHQNSTWLNVQVLYQKANPFRQRVGFPGSGPSNHTGWSLLMTCCADLFFRQEIWLVHEYCLSCSAHMADKSYQRFRSIHNSFAKIANISPIESSPIKN
jgi:hypothetical protein